MSAVFPLVTSSVQKTIEVYIGSIPVEKEPHELLDPKQALQLLKGDLNVAFYDRRLKKVKVYSKHLYADTEGHYEQVWRNSKGNIYIRVKDPSDGTDYYFLLW